MTTPHRRRTTTGRPPVAPRALHGHDGVPPPGRTSAGEAIGRRRGDEAKEPDLSEAAPVPVCRPRAATPEELDDARAVLVVHRLDPQVGRCAACAADCPCSPALDAGRILAEAGAWNTVPFPDASGMRTGQEPPLRGDGWVSRLARHLPWAAAK